MAHHTARHLEELTLSPMPFAAVLQRKLEILGNLSPEALLALERLPLTRKVLDPRALIAQRGDKPSHCAMLLSGWACRSKIAQEGKCQILSLHFAGDMVDLPSLHMPVLDHDIVTLTEAKVAYIPHAVMHELMRTHPDLAQLLWRDTLLDAAVFREWVVNVGQRKATERIAHLICEVFTRLTQLGLADERDGRCRILWPLTQADLSHAVGLSVVHVNRSMQALRLRNLIDYDRTTLTILDWQKLQDLAEFIPDYLLVADAA